MYLILDKIIRIIQRKFCKPTLPCFIKQNEYLVVTYTDKKTNKIVNEYICKVVGYKEDSENCDDLIYIAKDPISGYIYEIDRYTNIFPAINYSRILNNLILNTRATVRLANLKDKIKINLI